jgi:hypothetical protein
MPTDKRAKRSPFAVGWAEYASTPAYTIRIHNALHCWRLLEYNIVTDALSCEVGGCRHHM